MTVGVMDAQARAPEQGADPAEELAYRLRQQELLGEFGLFALKSSEFEPLLQEATRLCAQGLNSEFCKAMEYMAAENRFLVRAGVGWAPGVVGTATIGADLESPAGYALHTGEPVISNHLEGEKRFRTPELLAEHGVRRAINVIVRGEGAPYGVLEVDSPDEGRFTAADLAFMQGFASLLGVAIERHRAETALRQSMEHQDVLIREMSHRVKNSLQLVAGLLHMQGRAADGHVRQALADAEARVHTIAQVHDRIWRQNEVDVVDLSELLGELCRQLGSSAPQFQIVCVIAPVIVQTDRAVPFALAVNELVTNAFKYAFPGGRGEVRVTLDRPKAGLLRLEVCDRGVGLPETFDPARSRSLGMRLVTSLARQLGGELQFQDACPGTRAVLEVPHATLDIPPSPPTA